MEHNPRVQVVSPDELGEVLERARREGWTALAVFGRGSRLSSLERWPDSWRRYQTIYEVNGWQPQLLEMASEISTLASVVLVALELPANAARHLSRLTELTSLDLTSNELGAEGARHLATLTGLTSLDLTSNELGAEGARHLATLTGLTSLNLTSNQLGAEGARHLATLTGLTSLNLTSNELGAEGARHLATLTGLTSLNLTSNELGAEGARHLATLTSLTSLGLSFNQLGDEGARHLATLTGLTSLDLRYNQLGAEGARHLATLTGLTSLDLRGNQLGDEGARHLATLTGLTSLDLGGNELGAEGARHLATLTGLTSLDLRYNRLGAEGARHLATLTGLASLYLWGNELGAEGARHLATLTGLTSLDLSFNQLGAEGARHLATLTGLTSLDLRGNELGAEGARHLATLTSLTSLDLRGNELGAEGARHLATLTGLTSLNLRNNELGAAGARHLATLTGLTSLDLTSNQLGAEGAQHLATLTGLSSLALSDNQLGDEGARHLATPTGLTSLDLSANQIGDAGARHLATLTGLTSLDLTSNQIGDVGARHLATLTGLTSLDLTSNQIGDAGARHIAALSGLRYLDLSDTAITDVSPFRPWLGRGFTISSAGRQYSGSEISVQGCPLVRPPVEVVAQGSQAVLNYFSELDAQGVAHLYEAKILIVGEGGAGKTSLLRRLYQPAAPLPGEDESTRGIDILATTFNLADGRSCRLNVWDFGGQQIYHATHQFFLTKNAIYVLVDDTRKNDTSVHDPAFKYWLEVIEALSDRSPVLIFQNEKSGRSKTIDEAGIKGRFPNVQQVHKGDLATPDAAGGLKRAIEYFVQQLPHVGEALPAQWLEIRRTLEYRSRDVPFISQADYFDIYREHLPFDSDKALGLSRYLHQLGVLLHFQDDRRLRQLVILRNAWATEAVFSVLDDEGIKARSGRFSEADCDRVWRDPEHADRQFELISLMEKFELCYQLADSRPAQWLAPQLQPPSAPEELDRRPQPDDLILQYRYEFMPAGLVNRLMVRNHRFVPHPELGWKSGVLFEREQTRVLVVTADNGREIHMSARGPERKSLLSVIAADLDAVNGRFEGLEVEKWVPCGCTECATSSDPKLFAESDLMNRREKNKPDVECPASFERVSVLRLLDGLDLKRLPSWAAGDRERSGESDGSSAPAERTIQIFLASSSELREDRDAFDLYFRQQNDTLRKSGIYLQVVRWENFLDAMSETRLQDEYNEAVSNADIFVSLFATKAGRFTEEEFGVALAAFRRTGRKPRIYTYFKQVQVRLGEEDRDGLRSLWAFQDELKQLGHFYTPYESAEHLKRHFSDQLRDFVSRGRWD